MPYVYLVQPVELIGTKRYKIGMSSLNNLNRMKAYKNGTRYLCICEKANANTIEKKLIKLFNLKYKLIGGNEYFEVSDEQEVIEFFISIVMGYNNISTKEELPVEPKKEIKNNWMQKFAYKN